MIRDYSSGEKRQGNEYCLAVWRGIDQTKVLIIRQNQI